MGIGKDFLNIVASQQLRERMDNCEIKKLLHN
jgi:hypothetical protein